MHMTTVLAFEEFTLILTFMQVLNEDSYQVWAQHATQELLHAASFPFFPGE